MKLTKETDTDSGINWCSPVWNESDWPITFIVRLQYTDYFNSEWCKQSGKYHFEILAVSPEAAGYENCCKAADSCGLSLTDFSALPRNAQCEMLMDYGVSAPLWQATGNNRKVLEKEAREQLAVISGILFGFTMDRRVNAIGDTGWDWIHGKIGAAIQRMREEVTHD